ncbi:MAG: Asp-tRNA(Asn)/Glu-tRNA(Gln) amidotransferase subunit GatA [Candidatus Omnitrophica bacterium]|nr:Asp-tRNA(Asn)/Glu-tRNA(Gln) amidotransferase subunit GatA [Candidatus Omnitrophota bacterium]
MKTYNEYLKRIDEVDGRIRAFVHIDREAIHEEARRAKQGFLAGVPVAIKDNLCVRGEPTTCASRILAGFRPPYDAKVVEKLRASGALLFGKVNMDEFAFGSSCETSCYGPTRNPWDTGRIPGGSSGGSAAAVSSGEVPMALGSDTGGSIRQPAALCGVVGLKPTYGVVSRYGLIAFASSLDQIGPITKNVADAARLLTVIAGHDERDSTSVERKGTDYTKALIKDVRGLTIGIPKEYFIAGIDPDVDRAVKKAIQCLRDCGAHTVDISLPHSRYAVSCYYIIAPAEASSNLGRYDGVQYGLRGDESRGMIDMYSDTRTRGFGAEAKRRILLGTFSLSSGYYDAYYLKALKVRTKITEDFTNAFKQCDVIITPTTPTAAFKIGERVNDPLRMYLSDIFTIPANLAGIPGISVPCGFTGEHLPVGMQILGKHFDEETLFRAAYTFEQNTDHHLKEPPL